GALGADLVGDPRLLGAARERICDPPQRPEHDHEPRRGDEADDEPRRPHAEVADDQRQPAAVRVRDDSRRHLEEEDGAFHCCPDGDELKRREVQRADEVHRQHDPRRHSQPEAEAVVERLRGRAPHGFSQADTCFRLSAVNGERSQSAHRSRSSIPARRAIRSSSDGQTPRNSPEPRCQLSSWSPKWCETSRCVSASYSSMPTCVSLRSKTLHGLSGGRPTSITKEPPPARCAAALAKLATCASCVVWLLMPLKTR